MIAPRKIVDSISRVPEPLPFPSHHQLGAAPLSLDPLRPAKSRGTKRPAKKRVRTAPRDFNPSPWRQLAEQLPFRVQGNRARGTSTTWWALPASGKFTGGCKTGRSAAIAYLKFLRELRRLGDSDYHGDLQHIVLGMFGEPLLNLSRHGQIIGFFSYITAVLQQAVSDMPSLDDTSFAALAEEMKKGLACTEADDRRGVPV